ncbi:MAG: hypothetical protein HYX40_05265 [Sphingobacteriales bacterium]|nr:hypothetical protein [Sphingobacteriales bacterium]
MYEKLFSLFNTIVTTEYIMLIAAILLLHKKRVGVWRLFIPLLFIIVLTETYGWYLNEVQDTHNNTWIFSLNMIVSNMCLFWIFSFAEPLQAVQKKIHLLMIVSGLLAILNFIFFQGLQVYNWYSETGFDLLQVILCFYLFYATIKEEKYRSILGYEYFWLAIGVLISSLVGAFLYIFPTLLLSYKRATGINIFKIINTGVNLVLYLNVLIAFICRQKNTKPY